MRKQQFLFLCGMIVLGMTACGKVKKDSVSNKDTSIQVESTEAKDKKESTTTAEEEKVGQNVKKEKEEQQKIEGEEDREERQEKKTEDQQGTEEGIEQKIEREEIAFDENQLYGENSKIHSGKAILYKNIGGKKEQYTVCINAGHGTQGGESERTLCHPDGSPKVTGGSTAKGATTATAIASGMTFLDGTSESTVTLKTAKLLRDRLLEEGYNVLMIREEEDVQLDNIARTVLANTYADCHISLHWDSTETDKGAFYISVPEGSYREMEPVKSHWEQHERLGSSLIKGLKESGVKILSSEKMPIDLTQTSYSTIPSVDMELGDKASDHSTEQLEKIAEGIVKGLESFW